MKVIFYRDLIKKESIKEPSDMVVYSFLVSKAILKLNIFDGIEDYQRINKTDFSSMLKENNNVIDRPYYKPETIGYEVGLSTRNVKASMKRLGDLGLLLETKDGLFVKIINEVHKGFFIYEVIGLSASMAINYSYLKDAASKHNDTLNTWRAKLAQDLNTTVSNIDFVLTSLKKKGLISRVGEKLIFNNKV